MRFTRIWHPCSKWEELDFNMWGEVDDRKSYLERAIEFTGDHEQYGKYMLRVIREWPISTENALTDYNINRKAWVGHAACALAFRCPEDIVRQAWGYLTYEQRLHANKAADQAISAWEIDHAKSRGVHSDVGEAMLFGWDS